MPFTPSHAVVALPFVRTPLLPAAIAVGAMTPDLPLFLRSTPLSYQATHTNVLLSTVLAAGLLALWYAVLRPAVRDLMGTRIELRQADAIDSVVDRKAAKLVPDSPGRGLSPDGCGALIADSGPADIAEVAATVAASRYRAGSARTSSGNVITMSPASGRPALAISTRISSASSFTSRWMVPGV